MTDTTINTETTEAETTTAAVPAQEPYVPEALGATRIALLLAEHTGEPVTPEDVAELVAQEHLEACDSYKGWPMYSTAAARELDTALVRSVVGERVAWEAASLPRDAAASRIGWHWSDLVRMSEEGRITTGRGGRYLIADLDKMAVEADGEQYVTAQAAATDVLEIRASDWKYVEAAGWITPAHTYEKEVGRHRTVTVALYRLGDVRDLRDLPGVDWEATRGLPKGAPSPLREYAKLAPTRAAAVRSFAQGLADRHGITVWAWNSPYSGRWELGWERVEDLPTEATVRRELSADPEAGAYAAEVELCPAWGEITREARDLLEPGRAVVLDTETTDLYGRTVEIAVIDAATGKKLMDTLVNPGDAEISDGARWVHGITDEMVANKRPFEKVLPRLRKVTKGRTILAYNAEFDRSVVLRDIERAGKKPMHLEPWNSWYCLMQAYADWVGSHRWLRLGGSHRAAGDCESARQVLIEISKGRGAEFTPTPPAPGDPVSGPPAGTIVAATAVPQD
ncbi:exonuclease domain-containing protein [Streptomyces sp. NBC_01433]|uniref:3'-5' exonuclease n=1 Tax=Streptomyces sp. NBC_01433 TaxID=2903864 RepID=UPI0022587585|nr:exonuclease domain-containing protein [Streptomyces sp. NBC_01433]MCX4682621.1 exonuclease domain-containing protein [Streptomyces sp. NBC_01433]